MTTELSVERHMYYVLCIVPKTAVFCILPKCDSRQWIRFGYRIRSASVYRRSLLIHSLTNDMSMLYSNPTLSRKAICGFINFVLVKPQVQILYTRTCFFKSYSMNISVF